MPSFDNKGFQPLPTKDDDGSSDPAPPYSQTYHDDPSRGATTLTPFQQFVVPQTMESRPTNWLVPAIMATVCCFLPTGICAIVYANSANKDARYGNMVDANKNARTAKRLTIASIIVGIVVTSLIIVVYVVYFQHLRDELRNRIEAMQNNKYPY